MKYFTIQTLLCYLCGGHHRDKHKRCVPYFDKSSIISSTSHMSGRDQSLLTSTYSSKKAQGPSTILYYTHRCWRAVHQTLDPRILGCRLTELVVGENLHPPAGKLIVQVVSWVWLSAVCTIKNDLASRTRRTQRKCGLQGHRTCQQTATCSVWLHPANTALCRVRGCMV